MPNNPFFSIVTICYNSEKSIAKTIKSVKRQEFKDFEYIIVDGKSTDNTLTIIKEQTLGINNLHIISEKDNGIYDAMNKGIKLSNGKMIVLLNSDDWLEENALKNIHDLYEDDNTIITGALNFWYNKEKYTKYGTSIERFQKMKKKYLSPMRHPATIVPLSVYQKIGLFDTKFKIIGDTDFIYRCIENNINIKFTNQVLSNMSDGGVSNSFRSSYKRYKERIYFLQKRNLSKLYIFINSLYYLSLLLIKEIIPTSILIKRNQ